MPFQGSYLSVFSLSLFFHSHTKKNRGDLAMMMLSEIAYECIDHLIPYIPVILHYTVLGLDNEDMNVCFFYFF